MSPVSDWRDLEIGENPGFENALELVGRRGYSKYLDELNREYVNGSRAQELPELDDFLGDRGFGAHRPVYAKGSVESLMESPEGFEPSIDEFSAEVEPVLTPEESELLCDDCEESYVLDYAFIATLDFEKEDVVEAVQEGDYSALGRHRIDQLSSRARLGWMSLFGDRDDAADKVVDQNMERVNQEYGGYVVVSGEVELSATPDEISTYGDVLENSSGGLAVHQIE